MTKDTVEKGQKLIGQIEKIETELNILSKREGQSVNAVKLVGFTPHREIYDVDFKDEETAQFIADILEIRMLQKLKKLKKKLEELQ